MKLNPLYIHGMDSSSNGTKGRYFKRQFPKMIAPDFDGDLSSRLCKLEEICKELSNLVIVGSSFGGLMATCYATEFPAKINRLILLAPALNFREFSPPKIKLRIPTKIIIGQNDIVTPPDMVIPRAKSTFANLEIKTYDDDHLLRETFENLDWEYYITGLDDNRSP